MVSDFNYWTKVLKKIINLMLTLLLLFMVIKLSVFYLPFLIAFIIAMLIEPLIKFLMKKLKWTRRISSVFVILLSISLIACLIGWGTTTLFNEANNLLKGSDTYYQKTKDLINNITNNRFVMDNLPTELKETFESTENDTIHAITNWLIKTINDIKNWISKIPNLLMTFFFSLMGLYFMCTDKIYMVDQLEHHLPDDWSKKLTIHIQQITKSLGNYLKAEGTLILISFVISLIGLWIYKMIGLNIEYPLLSALGIGFIDALPILGSGTVMVPWAVVEAINGDIVLGIAIVVLWAIMGVVRNILEPKLISKHIGIHPVFTLIAMYTGYKIVGVLGMILGPILLIVLKEIYAPLIDKGIFREIFERAN